MIPKLGKNAIYVDLDALRRGNRGGVDLKNAPSARKETPQDGDDMDIDADPLAAIVALARRRSGR